MKTRTTGIEWTDHTWNPFVGCSVHTPGCTNCYAMQAALKLQRNGIASYQGTVQIVPKTGKSVWTGRVNRSSDTQVFKPMKVKAPSIFFVNSMSDFFHENARDEWRCEALRVMKETPRHQYQVLTKRPEEIQPFIDRVASNLGETFPDNMWLGVTVERGDYNFRIDILRKLPAAIRFISFEPLIGPIGPVDLTDIDWIITGGESGPGSRDCDPEWVREIHIQSIEQNVAHFFKQWGKRSNNPLPASEDKIGKGGSKLDGEYHKNMPDDFKVAAYHEEDGKKSWG